MASTPFLLLNNHLLVKVSEVKFFSKIVLYDVHNQGFTNPNLETRLDYYIPGTSYKEWLGPDGKQSFFAKIENEKIISGLVSSSSLADNVDVDSATRCKEPGQYYVDGACKLYKLLSFDNDQLKAVRKIPVGSPTTFTYTSKPWTLSFWIQVT